ncbi:MAG: glycosyltransferase family 39 protein [Phycisphaerales bacterium]|nr:glycosyltransferase family 39 protein [Phycisphaerales bacterium]
MRIDLGAMLARDNLRKHASGPLGALALVLLCCTVYLPGFFSIPPVDRDESRFAQASRQMYESVALPEAERDPELHSGGLAVPMVGGKPRLNKPPLIYWLQAASAAVFTGGDPLKDAIWMYRVPSLVAGLVIVLATWRIGCSMFDPRVGWVGACLLAVSPVFVWEAHQARADMVMVACTTLAMGQLWRLWRRASQRSSLTCPLSRPRRERVGERAPSSPTPTPSLSSIQLPSSVRRSVAPSFLLWVFVALGVLTKGPITPMVIVLTAAWLSVFSRNWRWLRATRPVLGVMIVVAAVAPWVWAVARQEGFGEYWSIVYDEVFGRAGGAKEGHWGPPGYHIVLLVVLFWPGSLLTGLSIGRAWRRGLGSIEGKRGREEKRRRKSPLPSPLPPGAGEGAGGARVPPSLRRSVASSLATLRSLRVTRRPEAFLLAWMLPSWLVFELVGTKLPHYTMPLYPAVALLTARGLMAWSSLREAQRTRAQRGAWIWAVVGVVLIAVVGLGALVSIGAPSAFVACLLLPFALIMGIASVRELIRKNLPGAQRWSVAIAVLLLVSFLASAAPGFFGMTQWAQHRATELADGGPVTWVGLREDSLVWFGRGRPSYTEPKELMAWFAANPDGLAVVSVYAEDSYLSHPEDLWAVEYASGYHYTKGRSEKLAFVERLPPE